ncbi:glycoside hydrolase family 32 protein [Microlunatus panaciterrae]|uniref:beta-fructofuranosidase n=1 Tax=Microlunatus panaciterrae TaxID=400768 RepID=A0ABS2RJX1_9ACTN|nr:glycoside hydrolase family 32 protein [Microlunatus panaciterrae]MBM7799304.1 beta-fructofuranosidase [Microlunatus panaciterrae]
MTRTDPSFPALHGRPDRGWLNDPNGLAYVDGTYHVFFQYNPDSPTHAAIKWGHISSTDLTHWRQEPIALVDRPGELDQYGCWTGCVTDDRGVPTAVYSAVADSSGRSEVLLARSDRTLQRWHQGTESVMGMPEDSAVTDVRDPFLFEFQGHRYAIQGAGHKEGQPQILLYRCDDLTRWTPLGALLTSDDPVAAKFAPANIWECPNLVPLDDRWVLVTSLWLWIDGQHRLDGVRYLLGDLESHGDGLRFVPSTGGVLDAGPTFYAPQLLVQSGRTLLWGWSWEDGRTPEQVAAAGWAGVLTYPRELFLVDDTVASRPAPELEGLRREQLPVDQSFAERSFEVVSSGPASVVLLTAEGEQLVAALPRGGRVFVDGSLVEAFPTGGLPATSRTYPDTTSFWQVRADIGGDVTVWRLGTD